MKKFFNEISISMSGTSRKTAVMALSDLKLADIEWRTKNKKKKSFSEGLAEFSERRISQLLFFC